MVIHTNMLGQLHPSAKWTYPKLIDSRFISSRVTNKSIL